MMSSKSRSSARTNRLLSNLVAYIAREYDNLAATRMQQCLEGFTVLVVKFYETRCISNIAAEPGVNVCRS